jgi:hypothetical protein
MGQLIESAVNDVTVDDVTAVYQNVLCRVMRDTRRPTDLR